jgi:hypothetical protein
MPTIKISAPKNSYSLLPEGKYEVFVEKFDVVETVNGVERSTISLSVRDDVDSEYGGRKIFTNVSSAENFAWLINAISKAIGIPTNTEFDSLTDFLNEISGKSLVVKVKHRKGIKDPSKTYVNAVEFYPTTKGDYKADNTDDNSVI